MEVTTLLCDSSYCRLCGQENEKCSSLFELQENKHYLSDLVNRYLPLKVTDDRKFPAKICPGCIFQLEATKSFFDLVIKGQITLRDLYAKQQETFKRQEKQRQQLENALKLVNPSSSIGAYTIQEDEVGEKILIQILSDGPLFSPEHELSLKTEGREKPRRKRGRPPKPPSEDNKENDAQKDEQEDDAEIDGDSRRRRRIKVPSRLQETLQGKEMDRIFKQEGVIDDDESLSDDPDDPTTVDINDKSINEIIGHMEDKDGGDLGELVVLHKTTNKVKIRPKSTSGGAASKRKRKFECDICSRVFSHAGRLEVHKSFHRNVNYMCGTAGCGMQTDSREAVEEHHKETGHSGVTLLETLDFEITEQPDQNKEVLLENAQITIENPGKEEELVSNFQPVKSSPEKEERTSCKICDKGFSCKQNYDIHVNAVHKRQKPYKCEKCNKTFPYISSYKCHMQQHSDKIFPCDICDKVFNHSSSLVYHKEAEHNNGRRFVCSKCKKTFKHKQLLLRHQLVHSNVRPHVCKYCDASFKTRANLLNHMPTHTGERKYYCNLCPNTFAHKTSLTFHMRWHNGSKPYECDVCLKSFSQKGNLAEHKRIHTGEKPFTCNQCDRKFTTSSQYKNHLKRHTGERPWQCEYCSKTFFHKDTWKSHTRRHSNERPFQCNQCMRAFTEQWALKKHQRLHTGEKPYVCEFCNKKFADSSNLAKHKKIHMSKINQSEKNNGTNIKIITSEQGEKILYLTYDDGTNDNDEPQTVVHIMDSLDDMPPSVCQDPDDVSIVTAERIEQDGCEDFSLDASLQLQQVIDNDGNPVNITTETGDVIKVVMSIENGQQAIQGLLSDGTLVPIDLVMQDGKLMSASLAEVTKEDKFDTDDNLTKDLSVPPIESMLESNMQFLSEDGQKLESSIQFLSEDGQSLCFVATYNSDDVVNSEYI